MFQYKIYFLYFCVWIFVSHFCFIKNSLFFVIAQKLHWRSACRGKICIQIQENTREINTTRISLRSIGVCLFEWRLGKHVDQNERFCDDASTRSNVSTTTVTNRPQSVRASWCRNDEAEQLLSSNRRRRDVVQSSMCARAAQCSTRIYTIQFIHT